MTKGKTHREKYQEDIVKRGIKRYKQKETSKVSFSSGKKAIESSMGIIQDFLPNVWITFKDGNVVVNERDLMYAIKEQQKEIEERKKGYLLENKLFTETLKKQCREIENLKKKNKNLMEEIFDHLDDTLRYYLGDDKPDKLLMEEYEKIKKELKKNKANNDLSDYQSGEL